MSGLRKRMARENAAAKREWICRCNMSRSASIALCFTTSRFHSPAFRAATATCSFSNARICVEIRRQPLPPDLAVVGHPCSPRANTCLMQDHRFVGRSQNQPVLDFPGTWIEDRRIHRRSMGASSASRTQPPTPSLVQRLPRVWQMVMVHPSLTWKDGLGEQGSPGIRRTSAGPRRSPLHLPSGRGTRRCVHRCVETSRPSRLQQAAIRCLGRVGVA
jgi:hypothetical protein